MEKVCSCERRTCKTDINKCFFNECQGVLVSGIKLQLQGTKDCELSVTSLLFSDDFRYYQEIPVLWAQERCVWRRTVDIYSTQGEQPSVRYVYTHITGSSTQWIYTPRKENSPVSGITGSSVLLLLDIVWSSASLQ